MANNNKAADKTQKKSWFQGLKAEFNKIIWTDRNTLVKQTTVVVCATIVLCAVIGIMDSVILQAINLLIK